MMRGQRGAALIETALALPVLLVALYGMIWGIRAGAVSERAEAAVRYAGVISAVANPYHDYSLYGVYNNLGTDSAVPTSLCTPPNKLFLSGGTFPVAVPGTAQDSRITPSFWQPVQAVPSCPTTNVRQLFAGTTQSYLLLQNVPIIDTLVDDGGFFRGDNGPLQSSAQTSDKFYRSADMATLMHCAATLSNAISASLNPSKYSHAGGPSAPLQASDFSLAPIAFSATCVAGIGVQPPTPPQPSPTFPPGSVPTNSPGPGPSVTPIASPTPTKPPVTPSPKPSATPTAGSTPTPKPTGGGGSGGGGGGTPTPTPTPKPGCCGTPKPVGSPSGAPTAAPTAAPTKTPSTPVPTTPPTKAPTATPQPSAAPSGPPGGIS